MTSWTKWSVFVVVSPFSLAASHAAEFEASAEITLSADAECDAEDSECAFSALQRRSDRNGGRVLGEAWGNCKHYGCVGYQPDHSCQCNAKCVKHRNCCDDYNTTCAVESSCHKHAYGCGGGYVAGRPCQCNEHCAHFGNCCSDYEQWCSEPGEVHTSGQLYGHPTHGKKYPHRDGFTLTLVEEFDHPLNLEKDEVWTWSDGGLSEGQVRFVKEGIRFEDGKLKLQVSEEIPSGIQQCSHAEVGMVPQKRLASGELRTRNNNFRYGYYEARIKAPNVQPGNHHTSGNFVSAFFLFRDGKFKHWREIDIEVTGEHGGAVHTNLLSADNTADWRMDMSHEEAVNVSTNLRSHFHTYGIEWLPHRIRWFVDGRMIRETHGEKIPVPTLSAKIVLNLWIFDANGKFGGRKIWNNQYPMEAECDWIRFYKWNGEDTYPCADLGTGCLTKDDWYLTSNNPCDRIRQEGTVMGKRPCVAECK